MLWIENSLFYRGIFLIIIQNDAFMRDKDLKICEIFNSISGEGLRLGNLATFIRFSGCNMKCSYLDTKYHTEVFCSLDTDYIDLDKKLTDKLRKKFVIITGEEPYCPNHDKLKKLIDWVIKKTIHSFRN